MHELAICNALIRQLEEVAREQRATKIVGIVVRIGPLSGVESDLLQRAYLIASHGSVAESADLTVKLTPIRVYCRDCGAETGAVINRLICADCGGWKTTLISGDELLLERVELERDEAREQHPQTRTG